MGDYIGLWDVGWEAVGGEDSGNGEMRRNHGREIQLESREMAFSRISVGGNGEMRRNLRTICPCPEID